MANPENRIENDIQNEIRQENKMGVMPVGRLLFTMSLPIMISMLVQALYNVVDSMFVARVSERPPQLGGTHQLFVRACIVHPS